MTQKEREDHFIEDCRKKFGSLTYEAELLLRYGYAIGADDLSKAAYAEGVAAQRTAVLSALGAMPQKETAEP